MELFGCCQEVSFGRSPTHEQGVAGGIALHLQEWNLIRHLIYLSLTGVHHLCVVLWIGGDDAPVGITFQTDIAVLIALHAWVCPIAYTTLIAQSRIVVTMELLGYALWLNNREFFELWNLPKACAVS